MKIKYILQGFILTLLVLLISLIGGTSFAASLTTGTADRISGSKESAVDKASEIILVVGSSRKVPVSTMAAIHLGNGKVVSIKDLGHEILLTGKAIGTTSLLVGSKNWKLEVVSAETFSAYEVLTKTAKSMIGISILVQNNHVVLTGEILRLRDWTAIADAARDANLRYILKAKLSLQIEKSARANIREALKEERLPEPNLTLTPRAVARIATSDRDLMKTFQNVLGPYGVSIEVSNRSLSLEPMVEVSILVAEVRKANFQKLGMGLPGSYDAQLLPTYSTGVLTATINAFEKNNEAKVLASPTLLCRSGKKASFLAGGEIPIKIVGGLRSDSQLYWKQYGILLNIKPVADASGRMSIEVQTEVSMVDKTEGMTIEGIPSLHTNRIQSHFDLERTRTIALSGLIKDEGQSEHGGIPLLKNLPVLGALFSSKEYQDHRTELVFFVTPKVYHDDPPDEEDRMKQEMVRADTPS